MNRDSDSTSHWEYVDFDLEIGEERAPRRYPVSVRSPEGEAKDEMRFPFDEWELKDKLRGVEVALLRSGGSRRRIGTSEEQAIQEFGRALFEALLVGEVGTHYRVTLREARRQNKGLRVKLHVRPPELSALPWEFVYDPKRDYLCLSSRTPLVRYPDVPHPIERLIVTPPLRILGMVASPQGLPRLDVEHEKRLVEEAVRALEAKELVELAWLEGQTWRDLQRAMRRGPWHVFHFIGHGGFDPETEEGAIALSDEEGRKHLLGATDLALLLDDHYFLRIVFLNSCEGAKGTPRDPFSSTAASLVRSGIPAVVAMQYEITDKAAIEFSRAFYEAIADGLPVDAAVAEARTAIKMRSTLEWGTPVLYLRSSDGRIFDVSTEAPLVKPTPEESGDREEEDALRRYREAVESAWANGGLDRRDAERLRELANELQLNANTAADIEREVMGDTIEAILKRQEVRRELARPLRVEVPDLSGQAVSQASSMLASKGLRFGAQNEVSSDTVPEGQIIEQSPEAGVEVEAGTFVSITVSSGPQEVIVTAPPDDRVGDHTDRPERTQPLPPASAGSKWALVLRGLVMGIFGLVLLTAFEPGTGQFRLYSALMIIADWLFVTIDARTRAGHRRQLLIQGRISGLVGFSVLLVWLVRDVLLVRYTSLAPGLDDLLKDLGIAPRLVGSWAIFIGIFRIIAAMQLRWETRNMLLMGTTGVLLVVLGILLWLPDFHWWRLFGLLALVSAITLIVFALRVQDRAEWDSRVSQRRV